MRHAENYKKAKEIVLQLRKTTDIGSAGIAAEVKRRGYEVSQSSVSKWCAENGMAFRRFAFTEEMRNEARGLKEAGHSFAEIASLLGEKHEITIKPGRIQWELSDEKQRRLEQAKLRENSDKSEKKELWEIAEELEAKGWSTADANTEIMKRWTSVSAYTSEPRSNSKSFSLHTRRWAA